MASKTIAPEYKEITPYRLWEILNDMVKAAPDMIIYFEVWPDGRINFGARSYVGSKKEASTDDILQRIEDEMFPEWFCQKTVKKNPPGWAKFKHEMKSK